jgi:hypothetical protein
VISRAIAQSFDRVAADYDRRNELEQACRQVFPGCELRTCGGPRAIAVIWDAAATG